LRLGHNGIPSRHIAFESNTMAWTIRVMTFENLEAAAPAEKFMDIHIALLY